MLTRQTAGGAHGPDGVLVSAVRTFNLREETTWATSTTSPRRRWPASGGSTPTRRRTSTASGPCPDWCKGRPHLIRGDKPSEQFHTSEVMHKLFVETARDDCAPEEGGQYWTLGVEIDWWPFAERLDHRRINGTVYIDGNDSVEMTPAQIRALADSLIPQADRLREFADLLESLHTEDMPDQGNPPPPTRGADRRSGV